MSNPIKIGSFPYRPGFNPYQRLATESIEAAGVEVTRIAPVKWFPVQHAFANPNCDLLHFDWPHDWYSGKNFATRFLKRWMYLRGLKARSTKKLVWTAHNLVAHDANDLQHEHQMLQRLISRCDGIVVMSDAAEQELRRLYTIPVSTLVQTAPHGHYIDCYPNEVSRQQSRRKLGIDQSEQIFLSLGAVRPYKGHLELIRSFGAIARPGQRLVVAGNANSQSYQQQLQNEANRQRESNPDCLIEFHLRSIPDEELQVFFNAADICVLPFAKVLNSGSLLMAMSFGIPVVASAMGSIPEVVFPESSVLFSSDATDGLEVALQTASERFPVDENLSHRAALIQKVREQYAWANFAHAATSLYRKVLDSDGRQ